MPSTQLCGRQVGHSTDGAALQTTDTGSKRSVTPLRLRHIGCTKLVTGGGASGRPGACAAQEQLSPTDPSG